MQVVRLFILALFTLGLAPWVSAQFSHEISLEELDLDAYQGKVIYLDFWASWCIPCRKSFPWMQQLHQDADPKELVIISVNLDQEAKDYESFKKKYPSDFTVVKDPSGKLATLFKVQAMPTSYLIDKKGVVVFKHAGFKRSDTSKLEKRINQLIAQS